MKTNKPDFNNLVSMKTGKPKETEPMKTIEEILKSLVLQVGEMKKYKEPMDEPSWNRQEGVLMSGNDAKIIIPIIRKHIKSQIK